MPHYFFAGLFELLGLLVDAVGLLLGGEQVVVALVQHPHVLLHDVVDGLELFLEAVCIFHGTWVIKLLLFLLHDSIEPHEVVAPLYGLQARVEVCAAQHALGFVEES